jgi:hypothetical protein
MRALVRQWLLVELAVLACVLTGGCAGPLAIRKSHRPYSQAVQKTASEELLLNLVRLKYRDPPNFLELGSLSTQFSFDAGASVNGTINEFLFLGADTGFSEKPTATYAPLQGPEFVKRLITPVDEETLVLLARTGWSVERVMRMSVQSLNELENARSASGPTPFYKPTYEEFQNLVKALRHMQITGEIEAGYNEKPKDLSCPVTADLLTAADVVEAAKEGWEWRMEDGDFVLVSKGTDLVIKLPPDVRTKQDALAKLGLTEDAKLDPDLIPPNSLNGHRFELILKIEPRSLIGAMYYLSQGVQVPFEHVRSGLVTITTDENGEVFDWNDLVRDFFQIRCSRKRPKCAAVVVAYRGHWFFIADNDLESKTTFSLLFQLFQLQAGGGASGIAPVLTLPVGGL